jgi:hypothetical protein
MRARAARAPGHRASKRHTHRFILNPERRPADGGYEASNGSSTKTGMTRSVFTA